MRSQYTLEEARKIIVDATELRETECIALADATGRVSPISLCALHPQPAYDQSAFDGFVVSRQLPEEKDGYLSFYLEGEIAAGDTSIKNLRHGKTYRIMTGALAPRGSWKVLPQEVCQEAGGVVKVPCAEVFHGASNLRKKGCLLSKGGRVVSGGMSLTPRILCNLAEAGYQTIDVSRKPRVSHFCTGSELVDTSAVQKEGLKVSSNRYLLSGLLGEAGAVSKDCGEVADRKEDILQCLHYIITYQDPDIVISTGGMGPGKYDLLEECFVAAGGKIFFSSLRVRPGKSVLFGILSGSLYFGLPGPPPAVHALFRELVLPALLKAQGSKKVVPNNIQAFLKNDIQLKKTNSLLLREGVAITKKGQWFVRQAVKNEISNCFILCPAGRKKLREGELVTIHLSD